MRRSLPRNTVLIGDARERLGQLPDASIDTVVTSPPHVALRDYGMPDQIGATPDVDTWIADMRQIGQEVARVIKPTGSWWLNLGDSYSGHRRSGAPPKSMLLAPERLVRALQRDGWTIRNEVIWAKNNPMPTSVKDRLACTWEVVYFLVQSRTYHFDLDAIRVPHRTMHQTSTKPRPERSTTRSTPRQWAGPLAGTNSGLAALKQRGLCGHPLGKNPGDVWTMPTANFRGEHFAVFPEDLVRRPILATCPEKVCASCGVPWTRARPQRRRQGAPPGELRPGCNCRSGTRPGIALDPFMGSGTVGVVARQLGRDWIGVELNPAFAALARERISSTQVRPTPQEETHRAAA